MVCFRQNEDRHVSQKIKLMKWNTLMDLIAIGLKNGDVSIHRLVNWQKIWLLSWPSSSSGKSGSGDDSSNSSKPRLDITAMEWRPDGKVLAIGYNRNVKNLDSGNEKDSSIALADIENGQVINTIIIPKGMVNCMCWQAKANFTLSDQYKSTAFTEFLEKLTPLTKSYSSNYSRKLTEEGIEDLMKVASQTSFNLLAVGTNESRIYFYSFGILLTGILELPFESKVDYISLSYDLDYMTVLLCPESKNSSSAALGETPSSCDYKLKTFQLPMFSRNSEQYFIVSHLYAKIISLLSYLEDIMGAIQETMEDILLELDSKLTNYLQPKGPKSAAPGTVLLADEILELLVIGTLSDSLEKFLHQLTDKGLKKLGHSIESTYSNIQKLVVCNVQRVCKHIFSHLHVLKAISLWANEFSQIGLEVEDINKALHSVATFYFKSLELQQVIDSSSQNVKCFFRWLYTVTCRFYTDTIPSGQQEMTKLSQQDLQHVADFIEENFDCHENRQDDSMSEGTSIRPTATNFTLERVGQYLKPEPLAYRNFSINDLSLNPWFKYLKERPMLIGNGNDSDLILYKHNSDTSLMAEHSMLVSKVGDAFKHPCTKFTETYKSSYDVCLYFILRLASKEAPKLTHISDNVNKRFIVGFIVNSETDSELALVRFDKPETDFQTVFFTFVCLTVNENNVHLEAKPIDIQFYNETTLSMLIMVPENQNSYLVQLPLSCIEPGFKAITSGHSLQGTLRDQKPVRININPSSEINYRKLENFKPFRFAVSGSRKVACVSSRTKRRVRIFEMDGNEEEAEEESEFLE